MMKQVFLSVDVIVMSLVIGTNVLQAKVGGPFEASTYFTHKRYFKDTYFISEPQTKFPEGAAVLRANDDPSPPAYFCLLVSCCQTPTVKFRKFPIELLSK